MLLALLLGAPLSCSLLVGGEPRPLRCEQEGQEGPPACEPGYRCRAGVCQVLSAAGGEASQSETVAGAGGAP